MNKNNLSRIKTVLIIFISFLFVYLISSQIFLAGTPKINPNFIANLKNAPTYIAEIPLGIINSFKLNVLRNDNVASTKSEIKSTLDQISVDVPATAGLMFKNVTTNVMAADDPTDSNIKYVQLQSGAKVSIKQKVVTDADGNKKVIKIIEY